MYSPKYAPHEGQQKIHESTKRLIFVHAGQRFGKDRWGVNETIHQFTEMLNENRPDHLIPRVHAWIIAPTIGLCKQLWRELLFFMPRDLIKRVNEHEMTMETVKGGVVEVKSATKNLFSTGLDIVYWSELSRMNENTIEPVFEDALSRLNSPGRGRGGQGGTCLVAGTPVPPTVEADGSVRKGFFQRFYESIQHCPYWDIFHFKSTDNPMITEEQYRLAGRLMPEEQWRCGWLGEFVEPKATDITVSIGALEELARCLGKSTQEEIVRFVKAMLYSIEENYHKSNSIHIPSVVIDLGKLADQIADLVNPAYGRSNS